jgi:hypothetical protein
MASASAISRLRHALVRRQALGARQMNPNIALPMVHRAFPAMPIFHHHTFASFVALTLFPDNEDLARKYAARWLVERDIPQKALDQGLIDTKFLVAILNDNGPDPAPKLVDQRRYWGSATGQIIKTLFALVEADDHRIREAASMTEALQLAEREIGRSHHERRSRTSFHPWLRLFRRALHMQAALALTREGFRQPQSADALMLNAMIIHQRLCGWHVARRFTGSRAKFLDADDAFWRWQDMHFDPHGVPVLSIGFENLTRRQPGRPQNY